MEERGNRGTKDGGTGELGNKGNGGTGELGNGIPSGGMGANEGQTRIHHADRDHAYYGIVPYQDGAGVTFHPWGDRGPVGIVQG